MIRASNSLIKELKKQKRENCSLLFLDNLKIINDVLKKGIVPKFIITSSSEVSFETDCPIYSADAKTIEQLSDSKTPQGVVCVVEYKLNMPEKPKTNFLVLDGVQDPGNAGTLVRTAVACGFEYVFFIESVHATNSKLVRSSVGTIFDCKIFEVSRNDFINMFKKWNLKLLKADMHGENIFNFKADSQIGVVVGNEGQGVSDEIAQICSQSVSIPMKNNVESLNASVSGSIIMYQIAKEQF